MLGMHACWQQRTTVAIIAGATFSSVYWAVTGPPPQVSWAVVLVDDGGAFGPYQPL